MGFLRHTGLRRDWLARKAPAGPAKAFYETPYPDGATLVSEVDFVALDLETTGLSAKEHEIVSVGWAPIRNLSLDMSESVHQLIKPKAMGEDSVVVHHIFDDHVKDAPTIDEVMGGVLEALAGRVLIAHHCRVEWTFLDVACRRVYGVPFEIPTVDTLDLERRVYARANRPIKKGALRLDALRQQYNLPRYRAHNALVDAIACGELFLAQVAHRGSKEIPNLKSMWV